MKTISESEFRYTHKGVMIKGKPHIMVEKPSGNGVFYTPAVEVAVPVRLITDWQSFKLSVGKQCIYAKTEGPHRTACLQHGVQRTREGWLCDEHRGEKPRERWVGFIQGA